MIRSSTLSPKKSCEPAKAGSAEHKRDREVAGVRRVRVWHKESEETSRRESATRPHANLEKAEAETPGAFCRPAGASVV